MLSDRKHLQENPHEAMKHIATVPKTDTGGQVENTKALGITPVKELGKMIP